MLKKTKIVGIILLVGLMLYEVLYFGWKVFQSFACYPTHSATLISDFVRKNIPQGSKIVAEPAFFYAITQSGSKMMYANLFGELPAREQYHRQVWDYDYLLLRYNSNPSGINHYYQTHGNLVCVDSLILVPTTYSLVPIRQGDGYSAILYKRIR